MSSERGIGSEGGFTIIELLAGIISFVVLFGAIMQMTILATHNQDRIAKRVGADQRVRPVVSRIMDSLRSSCVAPNVVPLGTASNSTSITFISRTGESVNPVPNRHIVTLSGTNLTEQVFPATGGTPPVWTYSATPISSETTPNVSAPGNVLFRYYNYVNGQLNTTPLGVPLNSNAANAAFVTMTLTAAPRGGASTQDARSPITITDSADLRLESASSGPGVLNAPCT